jgi:hypothetical protein
MIDAAARMVFCSSSFLSYSQYWPLCTFTWNYSEISQDVKMQLAGLVQKSGGFGNQLLLICG